MIDIHSHIIFDVDDGPKTIEDSLKLLEYSVKKGAKKIIATSHRRKKLFEAPEEKIKANFEKLKEVANEKFPDLELYYGAEIYFTVDIFKKIEEGTFPTLAESKYVLIEFNYNITFKELYKVVDQVTLLGKIPVLAHIERYKCLAFNNKNVEQLINKGAYIQINSSSVMKAKLFGDKQKERKKRAKYLLEKNLVHFVASDMHNNTTRPPLLSEAYLIVKEKYGTQRAEDLFENNPNAIINNEYI